MTAGSTVTFGNTGHGRKEPGAAVFDRAGPWALGSSLPWLLALILVAGLVQLGNPGVTDVSWLIVVGERVLNGEQLYKDVLEVNPPASLLIYMPAIAHARWLGVRAEYVVLAGMLAVSAVAILGAGRILKRAGLLPHPTHAAIAATLAFVTLSGNSFAQREHVGLVLVLPMLALIAWRALGAQAVTTGTALAVGIAAGIAVSIKPHFAAAILLPQLYAAWRTRSLLRFFHAENWTVLAVVVGYGLTVVVWYPEFWSTVMPLVTETYRAARVPFLGIVYIVIPFLITVPIYCYAAKVDLRDPGTAVPLAAALGFLLGYFEQSKGWQYHYFPAVALALYVVLLHALSHPQQSLWPYASRPLLRKVRMASVVLLLASAALHFAPYIQISYPLEPMVRSISESPRVMALTGDLGVSHPFTRRVHGTWVGTVPSQWLTDASQRLLDREPLDPAKRASLQHWLETDRALVVEDIRRGTPDVILIDLRKQGGFKGASRPQDWKTWGETDPDVGPLLAGYRSIAVTKDVELLARKDLVRKGFGSN